MTKVVYEIVRHDGGWAFKLGNTMPNAYPACTAAKHVAIDQMQPWSR